VIFGFGGHHFTGVLGGEYLADERVKIADEKPI
jgi:hypothetical protein